MARLSFSQVCPEDAIATTGSATGVKAGICRVVIAIIAAFKLDMVFREVRADEGITTTGEPTGIQATVILLRVAIIAFLVASLFRPEVCALDVVAAASDGTSTTAAITLLEIAVVAFFFRLEVAVATFSGTFTDNHLFGAGTEKEEDSKS